MSKEEDFACDSFAPQKLRKDTCRNCYQVLRLHEKKQGKPTGGNSQTLEPSISKKPPPEEEKRKSEDSKKGYVTQLIQQDVTVLTESGEGGGKISSSKSPPPPTSCKPKKEQSMKRSSTDVLPSSLPPVTSLASSTTSDVYVADAKTVVEEKVPPRPPPSLLPDTTIKTPPTTTAMPDTKDKEVEEEMPSVPSITESSDPMPSVPLITESSDPMPSVPPITESSDPMPFVPPITESSDPIPSVPPITESSDPMPSVPPITESSDPMPSVPPITELSDPMPSVPPITESSDPMPSVEHPLEPDMPQSNLGEKVTSPPALGLKADTLTDDNYNDEDQSYLSRSTVEEPSQVAIVNEEKETRPENTSLAPSPCIPAPPASTPTQVPIPLIDIVPGLLIPLDQLRDAQAPPPPEENTTETQEVEEMESIHVLPLSTDEIPISQDNGTLIPTSPMSDSSTDDISNPAILVPPPPQFGAPLPPPPPSPPFGASLPPPPPPPPPPLVNPIPRNIPKVRLLSKTQPPDREAQDIKTSKELSRGKLLQDIRTGTSLRKVSPPPERTPHEEKVVDIQSELKQRVLNLKKKESESIATVIDVKKSEANSLCQQLSKLQHQRAYFHSLVDMLKKLDEFVEQCGLSPEVMEKRMNWPVWLIEQLRNVVRLMHTFEGRIVEVERLCGETLQTQQLNVERVQRCAANVIFTVREVKNDLSRETAYTASLNVFPVDEIDIHRLMKRTVDSLTPLLDKLYEKALHSHAMINDPSVSKFDLNFRLQNSIRLLRMCCQISDTLMTNLDVHRHPKYSEAMLKANELDDGYKKQIAVMERKGEWDADENVDLKPSYNKRSPAVIKEENDIMEKVMNVIRSGGTEEEIMEAAGTMSEEMFLRAEVKLIKVALASCQTKMIDVLMSLRNKLLTEHSIKIHEFDWLHEAVQKANKECLKHMVTVYKIPINCQSSDAGNSALHIAARRHGWYTMAELIRLGAYPLLVNTSSRNPIQMTALKCFPPQHFPEIRLQELPFDLSSYINNQSLSDAKLESNEGEEFHVHRLVLCGQSPVFKSMLESDHWATDRLEGNKVCLPNINSRTMKLLLQYLYTGESTFPNDDLNTWIDLLAAADEFLLEPLRLQCEKVLSAKIDPEVVVPMLYGSFRYSAKKLLVNCCNYLLENYENINDPDHVALLYILDNSVEMMPKQSEIKTTN